MRGALASSSNVVRYGCARALCLSRASHSADGGVRWTASARRADNTGYDLHDVCDRRQRHARRHHRRDAETLSLAIGPRIAGFVALPSLAAALNLLIQMRQRRVVRAVCRREAADPEAVFPNLRPPLQTPLRDRAFSMSPPSGTSTFAPGSRRFWAPPVEEDESLDDAGASASRVSAVGVARSTFCRDPHNSTPRHYLAVDEGRRIHRRHQQPARRSGTVGLDGGPPLGDGNLHVGLCRLRRAIFSPEQNQPPPRRALMTSSEALGGSLSADIASGQCKRESLAQRKRKPGRTRSHAAIKSNINPRGNMNPGKCSSETSRRTRRGVQ